MEQCKKEKSQYATVAEEGTNYREIADMMTMIGYKMNHSSARNYVLRVMKKFAHAITKKWSIDAEDERIDQIIKNPQFQDGICVILQEIEASRKILQERTTVK